MRRKRWALVAAAALAAVVVSGVVVMSDGKPATPAAQEQEVNTATVQEAKLSYVAYQDGTLTYRAQPDGSPYGVVDQAHGTYTMLPSVGDQGRLRRCALSSGRQAGRAAVRRNPRVPVALGGRQRRRRQ